MPRLSAGCEICCTRGQEPRQVVKRSPVCDHRGSRGFGVTRDRGGQPPGEISCEGAGAGWGNSEGV